MRNEFSGKVVDMSRGVKPLRPYNSPRRRAQAAATGREILEAAHRLFTERGYGATTMAAIAAEAGVATKTVYLAFATKSGVLRALWNHHLRAGRDDVPVGGQPWYREVLEEPDPRRQLRLNARNSRAAKLRIAAVIEVIRAAAPLDPDIAELWRRIESEFHANQRAVAESLDAKGALRPGLGVDEAADVLWTINHPSLWEALVRGRGWTPERYERWTGDLACSELLGDPPAGTPSPGGPA
jgi:AcrR family transcriptional regulator